MRELKCQAHLQMREDRAQHRLNRAKTSVPVLAMVGYTNAGKSCLMNQLTLADVLSEDALFATLDTTVRKISLPSGLQVSLNHMSAQDNRCMCHCAVLLSAKVLS